MYDICIIGAGTSGLMASIASSAYGTNTLVIDKNKIVGKKLRLTGGGRCNVTNNKPIHEIINHIPGNGKFLYSSFSQFNNQDIIDFFNNHHTPLKEEDNGRMFPISDKSKDIVETLYNVAISQHVQFKLQETVTNIKNQKDHFVISTNRNEYSTKKLIICTGGKTYTYTGSTGDGYKFAHQFGHTITKLYPTECPLLSNDWFIQDKSLQGLSFNDVLIKVINNQGKLVDSHQLDLLFTHFGISGPAVLRSSGAVFQLLKQQKEVQISIDFYPKLSIENLSDKFQKFIQINSNKQISSLLNQLLPERLNSVMIKNLNLDKTIKCKQLTTKNIDSITQYIKNFDINIYDTWPLEKAFVTGGGININEINPKTMESKLQNNLYFAGELIDVNGYTGGFNITAALSTGYTAGSNAALQLWE